MPAGRWKRIAVDATTRLNQDNLVPLIPRTAPFGHLKRLFGSRGAVHEHVTMRTERSPLNKINNDAT